MNTSTSTVGSASAARSTSGTPVRANAVVAVLAFAGIVAALMQTLVVPLIGQLPELLDTTASNASWVITATLLAAAVATPVSGRLGDLYGKRRVMLFCAALLIVGSLVCALSLLTRAGGPGSRPPGCGDGARAAGYQRDA